MVLRRLIVLLRWSQNDGDPVILNDAAPGRVCHICTLLGILIFASFRIRQSFFVKVGGGVSTSSVFQKWYLLVGGLPPLLS